MIIDFFCAPNQFFISLSRSLGVVGAGVGLVRGDLRVLSAGLGLGTGTLRIVSVGEGLISGSL